MALGHFTRLIIGTNLTGTDNGDGSLTIAAIGGGSSDPSTDTKVWMPLTTTVGGDDVLVFDASHQLIPTLTPI